MKLKRLGALLLVLVLAFSAFCQTAFADTWYLENGDILVEAGESGQYVYQGDNGGVEDSAPVITQQDQSFSTSNNITLQSEGDAVVQVTVQDVNIQIPEGEDSSAIDVVGDSNAVVVLEGDSFIYVGEGEDNEDPSAAIHVSDGDLTIQGDGYLDLSSNTEGAKIGSDKEENMSGSIHITGDVEIYMYDDGSEDSAGIGSGEYGDFTGSITIDGDAYVRAHSNDRGAGIGAGEEGDFRGNVTIGGNAVVDAEGDDDSAGIGSGQHGSFSGGSIVIKDNAEVEAEGDDEGPAIGAADDTPMNGTITIQDNATVTLDPGSDCDVSIGAEGDNAGSGSINIRGNASLQHEYGEPIVLGGETPEAGGGITVDIDDTALFNGYSYEQILNGEAPEGVLVVNSVKRDQSELSCFRVLDENGEDISFERKIEGETLVVSLEAEYAEFRGNRQAILLLMAAEVDSVRFVTSGASSLFEFDDLADYGTPDSIVSLVHSGETAMMYYDGVETPSVLD